MLPISTNRSGLFMTGKEVTGRGRFGEKWQIQSLPSVQSLQLIKTRMQCLWYLVTYVQRIDLLPFLCIMCFLYSNVKMHSIKNYIVKTWIFRVISCLLFLWRLDIRSLIFSSEWLRKVFWLCSLTHCLRIMDTTKHSHCSLPTIKSAASSGCWTSASLFNFPHSKHQAGFMSLCVFAISSVRVDFCRACFCQTCPQPLAWVLHQCQTVSIVIDLLLT